MSEEGSLPLFPLGTVLFPGGRMKLRIFEPRYLNMVKQCMQEGSGFGVVGIAEGNEAGTPATPFDVGVVVNIIDFEQLPEGLLGLTIEGQQRFSIDERWIDAEQRQCAEVNYLPSYDKLPLLSNHQEFKRILSPIFPQLQTEYGYEQAHYDDAAWVLGRLVEILPLPLPLKVELLSYDHPHDALNDLAQRMQRADEQIASRHF